MRERHREYPDGFTLVELLVVVSIIGLLVAILLPSMSKARKQSQGVACMSRCHQLGVGMTMYVSEYDVYPPHQIRVGDAADTRIRWFNAMASLLNGFEVQSCPTAGAWQVGRNNSYGYNYKYVGSFRDNESTENPFAPYERFPVKNLRSPSATLAFADCDGTGWELDYEPDPLKDGKDMYRFGNHGYTLDPTYIPVWSEQTYSGGELEPYAWHNWRTYLSERHLGRSAAVFADGHGEMVDPRVAYRDNSMWNGLGVDPGIQPNGGQDVHHPLYVMDPHVSYKWDESSGQEWRYGELAK